jgi:hypothetical protein
MIKRAKELSQFSSSSKMSKAKASEEGEWRLVCNINLCICKSQDVGEPDPVTLENETVVADSDEERMLTEVMLPD